MFGEKEPNLIKAIQMTLCLKDNRHGQQCKGPVDTNYSV